LFCAFSWVLALNVVMYLSLTWASLMYKTPCEGLE